MKRGAPSRPMPVAPVRRRSCRPEVWNPSLDGANHAQAQPTADHQRLDASTPIGAQFAASGDTVTELAKYDLGRRRYSAPGRAGSPQFAAINADFAVHQGRRQQTPVVLALGDGHRIWRQLAKQTGREFDYLVLYGEWSESSHIGWFSSSGRASVLKRGNRREALGRQDQS